MSRELKQEVAKRIALGIVEDYLRDFSLGNTATIAEYVVNRGPGVG
jgi:hypothetical protein